MPEEEYVAAIQREAGDGQVAARWPPPGKAAVPTGALVYELQRTCHLVTAKLWLLKRRNDAVIREVRLQHSRRRGVVADLCRLGRSRARRG